MKIYYKDSIVSPYLNLLDLLNKVRIGYVELVLKEKFIDWNDPIYSGYVLGILAEKVLARNYNDAIIQKLDSPMVSIDAIEQLLKGVTLPYEESVYLRARNLQALQILLLNWNWKLLLL